MLSTFLRYRVLLFSLVGRHLKSRYRGSVLGFLWTLLNPLGLMLVYTLVFKFYIRFSEVPNYTIFLFCGLLPWLWLSTSLAEGASSIVSGGALITKAMFPAELLPAVAVVTNLINFLLSLPLLFIFMLIGGVEFHLTILFLPILIIVQLFFLLGLSLLLSAVNVKYRDVQHLLGNLLTFLFFLTPVIYPSSVVPDKFRFTMDYNPFALFTIFYHNLILDGVIPPLSLLLYATCFSVIAMMLGLRIFNRYRESFAEAL